MLKAYPYRADTAETNKFFLYKRIKHISSKTPLQFLHAIQRNSKFLFPNLSRCTQKSNVDKLCVLHFECLSGGGPHATIRFEVSIVKGTVLIPVKYLLIYLLCAFILTLGVYVYSWCENPMQITGMHEHAGLIFRSLYAVLVPASLIALVILILMLQGGKGIPWLMFIALWLSFSGLLFLQIAVPPSLSAPAAPGFFPGGDPGKNPLLPGWGCLHREILYAG